MTTSRVQMIIETLKNNPTKKFTARELAIEFIKRYPTEIELKQNNPRYDTQDKLITQLAAEIGGKRTKSAKAKCPNVITRDTPRPRIYFWDNEPNLLNCDKVIDDDHEEDPTHFSNETSITSEHDLYPLLIEFMSEKGVMCQRIDEKTSKNTLGIKGNHWLHPDIVGLEPVDQHWNDTIRDCARNSRNSPARLWSFEVKKKLFRSNVREAFFQTVSNSSWANLGYLVAPEINEDVENELQMLCSLHGIGVIVLNTESLFDSQILIPAREKMNVDWQSVNRIANENSDFYNFIEQVGIYHATKKITKSAWNY